MEEALYSNRRHTRQRATEKPGSPSQRNTHGSAAVIVWKYLSYSKMAKTRFEARFQSASVGQRATLQPHLTSPNWRCNTEMPLIWGPKSGSQKVKNSFLSIRCHYTPVLHSFERKSFVFLHYQNIIQPKTTRVFKVYTLSNEEMRRDAYFHEKNNRLKATFKISNLTVFIYGLGHAKEEFHNQSEELPRNRARLK